MWKVIYYGKGKMIGKGWEERRGLGGGLGLGEG